jgi:hypothetical protein
MEDSIMADDRRPADPAAHRPEQEPAPGFDPVHPANDPAVERDPAAAPPRGTNTTVVTANSGRGGLYAAAYCDRCDHCRHRRHELGLG